jgi:hypothetical protein
VSDETKNDGTWIVVVVGGVIVLAAAFCLVAGVGLLGFAFLGRSFAVSPPSSVQVTVPPLPTALPTALPTPSPQPSEGSQGGAQGSDGQGGGDQGNDGQSGDDQESDSQSSEDIAEQMAAVEEQVADVRGLPVLAEVPKAYLSPEDLHERVVNDFFEDYTSEEAHDDTLFFAALDAVPPDFDFYAFYIDLYSEGIAGYYDPEEDEFFLIGSGETFTASDEWIFSHEFTHALQDQHFDLEVFLHYDDDEWHIEHADASIARTALIEGDAVLTSMLYLVECMSTERQTAMWAESMAQEEPAIYASAPPFLLEDFFFPYEWGYLFVETLHDRGGYDLVDQAYADPPTTTEQILHPERYLDRDEPQAVDLEDALAVLGEGYREVYVQPLGEWYLQLYLKQLISTGEAEQAAAGWDGDRVAVYVDEGEALVMVLRTVWDSAGEAGEFADLFVGFGEAWSGGGAGFEEGGATCWEGDDVLCLLGLGDEETLVVRAPDRQTAGDVLGQYTP